MKNPPNRSLIIGCVVIWVICTACGIFAYFMGPYDWLMPYIVMIVSIVGGFMILTVMILKQTLFRPKEVEVKEEGIVIHWQGNRIQELPYGDIVSYYLDPRAPKAWNTKWAAGSIEIKGSRMGFQLSYEILVEIGKRYYEEFERYPPKPSWAKGR